jgi:hypothetical protein
MGSSSHAKAAQAAAKRHVAELSRRNEGRTPLRAQADLERQVNLKLHRSDRDAQDRLSQYDAETARLRTAFDAEMQRTIESVAAAHVMAAPPDFAPANTTDAARIGTIVGAFKSYSPGVAFRIAREAIARGDLALASHLRHLLDSYKDYRKEFESTAETRDVVEELDDLLATDDVIRSEAATEWIEATSHDLQFMRGTMEQNKGVLDPMFLDAMPTLFPKAEPAAPASDAAA